MANSRQNNYRLLKLLIFPVFIAFSIASITSIISAQETEIASTPAIIPDKEADEKTDENYVIDVLMSEDEALKLLFPKCDKIMKDTFVLTTQEIVGLQSKLNRRIFEESFEVFVGMKGDKIEGYTAMSEEIGKFHPFTYAVCTDTKGKIKNTAILIYRESRGGEISHKRFLYQYKGKSLKNPIKINKDIINITGATMSVRMMCSGVRKVLGVIDEFYLKQTRTPDSSTEHTVK